MSDSSREEFTGWAWVTLGGIATVLLPVWVLLTAVVVQLSPELSGLGLVADPDTYFLDGAPAGPGTLEVIVRGGRVAAMIMLGAAPLVALLGGTAWAASALVRSRQRRARVETDAAVAESAVLEGAELKIGAADPLRIEGATDGVSDEGAGAPAIRPNHDPFGRNPADPGRRVAAAVIDGLLAQLSIVPAVVGLAWAWAQPVDAAISVQLGVTLAVTAGLSGGLLGVQLWLLRLGQTVGKRQLGLRIVRFDGARATLVHTFWRRGVAFWLLASLVPVLGPLVIGIIDVGMLFGEDRRTLHDLFAGTTVIDA